MKAVPTPRTDRECDDYAGPLCWIGGTQFIPADFARTLERELAAKDAEITRMKSEGGYFRVYRGTDAELHLMAERDQLRDKLAAAQDALHGVLDRLPAPQFLSDHDDLAQATFRQIEKHVRAAIDQARKA